jgi:uncharacterized Zn-finger protein
MSSKDHTWFLQQIGKAFQTLRLASADYCGHDDIIKALAQARAEQQAENRACQQNFLLYVKVPDDDDCPPTQAVQNPATTTLAPQGAPGSPERKEQSVEKQYHCPECHRRFGRKWTLKNHLLTHDSNRKRNFSCPWCTSAFHRECDLVRHIQRHGQQNAYKCDCGKVFSRKDALVRHGTQCGQYRQSEPAHLCACGSSYHRRSHLANHKRQKQCGG